MAALANPSRILIGVPHRDDLAKHFPFNQLKAALAYAGALRAQGHKPWVKEDDERSHARISLSGQAAETLAFSSKMKADGSIRHLEQWHHRHAFDKFGRAHTVSLAQLLVRYLLESLPQKKSQLATASCLMGWLVDSGQAGIELLRDHRARLSLVIPVQHLLRLETPRSAVMGWIQKPFADITVQDIEGFVQRRLEVASPATVNRDIDRLTAIFRAATSSWDYPLASNPMRHVRRPRLVAGRDRRISAEEEARLLDALAKLDVSRAVNARLVQLCENSMAVHTFTSDTERRKALAAARARLTPRAAATVTVEPYLEAFYEFLVCSAAHPSQAFSLTWDCIDVRAQTAFVSEPGTGRLRKLVLPRHLLALLDKLPRDTPLVFGVGKPYIVTAWATARKAAGVEDLRMQDVRHESITRFAEGGPCSLLDLMVFAGQHDSRRLKRYVHLCASSRALHLVDGIGDGRQGQVNRETRILRAATEGSLPRILSWMDGASGDSATAGAAAPNGSNVIRFPSAATGAR